VNLVRARLRFVLARKRPWAYTHPDVADIVK